MIRKLQFGLQIAIEFLEKAEIMAAVRKRISIQKNP